MFELYGKLQLSGTGHVKYRRLSKISAYTADAIFRVNVVA
jgi:hypothetical protein